MSGACVVVFGFFVEFGCFVVFLLLSGCFVPGAVDTVLLFDAASLFDAVVSEESSAEVADDGAVY